MDVIDASMPIVSTNRVRLTLFRPCSLLEAEKGAALHSGRLRGLASGV